MIKVFDTVEKFEGYTANGMISGNLYYVTENESVHFRTNNINGIDTSYNIGGESGTAPTGNITITENGDNIDVAQYATATVNVPAPTPSYNELQSDEEGQVFIPCAYNDIIQVIGSNQSAMYTVPGFFDSSKEYVASADYYIFENDYTIDIMIYRNNNNIAYVGFVDTAGGQFTARYRKLN